MERDADLALSNAGQLELLRAFVQRGAALRTSVRGASMSPFIRDRDVLTVAPLEARGPRVGDVVAVALGRPERLFIHRVVACRPGGWLIRGDACRHADGVAAPADVVGRVVAAERRGRAVRLGIRSGVGGGAIVALLSRGDVLRFGLALWRLPRRLARR